MEAMCLQGRLEHFRYHPKIDWKIDENEYLVVEQRFREQQGTCLLSD
jgi:hypothetical protein